MCLGELAESLERIDLKRLGFRAEDEAELREVVGSLQNDLRRLARIKKLASQVQARIGNFAEVTLPRLPAPEHLELHFDVMLALILSAEKVQTYYAARGVDPGIAWKSLSDLGQQVHIFRRAFGKLGIATADWSINNFTGRHLWIGRLQYTLEEEDGEYVVYLHIPEAGPLHPHLVDESLQYAQQIFTRSYREFPISRWAIHSWMVDPDLMSRLDADSNLASFARRFDVYGPGDGDPWGPLFFIFQRDLRLEPVDLGSLPTDTSLRKAALRSFDHGISGSFHGELKTTFSR